MPQTNIVLLIEYAVLAIMYYNILLRNKYVHYN